MPNIESIISRGYFPRELPPSFTTSIYGLFLESNISTLPACFNQNNAPAKISIHNLARGGTLRRKLGIPNPVHYYQLTSFVVDNWQELHRHASLSRFSMTTPVEGFLKRAIERQHSLNERTIRRAQLRSTSKYILQADINHFYPSIYTHSIPWAIHTKAIAKTNRSDALIGNRLDRLVRNAQDGQTMGIPIGPDISLLIAEIILSAVDIVLYDRGIRHGFRYIDDYEFGFRTLSEAERTLAVLQEMLNEYELSLNPNKTEIITLPHPTEPLAISELRTFTFRSSVVGQQSDILRYFDRAFFLSSENPEEGVLKYAIARLSGEDIHSSNWNIFESFLLQCVMAEPGTLPFALNQILRYRDMGYNIDRDNIGQVLNEIICQHAPLGHGSEVAWALWGLLVLRLHVSDDCVVSAVNMHDSIVGILLMDAANKSLITSGESFSDFQALMTTDNLYGEHWLLSYEANIKKWLPSRDTSDHVTSDCCFSLLKRSNIYFYDETLSDTIGYSPPEGWRERY